MERRLQRLATTMTLTVILGFALAMVAIVGADPVAGAADSGGAAGIPAPVTQLSADGRTATDGTRSLSVSLVHDLNPKGQRVMVEGKGYDSLKGVYVALCAIPAPNQVPSPCGGGVDMSGTSTASQWISSNPPAYAVGLTIPYGPGGTFKVNLDLSPAIGTSDCRRVPCAIVTRNDHTRGTDRGQDIFVPVAFGATPAPASPPTTAPPATPPPATSPPASIARVDPPGVGPNSPSAPAAAPQTIPGASSTSAAQSPTSKPTTTGSTISTPTTRADTSDDGDADDAALPAGPSGESIGAAAPVASREDSSSGSGARVALLAAAAALLFAIGGALVRWRARASGDSS